MVKNNIKELYKGTCVMLLWGIMHSLYNIKVYGKENIPNKRAIIAANHASFSDPVFIVAGLNKKIHFFVKHYIQPTKGFENSFAGKFLKSVDQIILDGGKVDKESFRNALEILEKKWLLGIFPEGTRSNNGKLQRLEEGVARISYLSKTPIVPIGIKGTYEIWPTYKKFPKLYGKIKINIGKPLYPDYKLDKKQSIKNLTDITEKEISRLLDS